MNRTLAPQLFSSAFKEAGGTVDDFLDSFFAFLADRTDFYQRPSEAFDRLKRAHNSHLPLVQDLESEEECDHGSCIPASVYKCLSNTKGNVPVDTEPTSEAVFEIMRILPTQTRSGNGMDYGLYVWTQTLSTIDITLKTSRGEMTSRDLQVHITPTSLAVVYRDKVLLSGDKLLHSIDVHESTWTLVDGRVLELSLRKIGSGSWWPKLWENGTVELDPKLIQPENVNSLSELEPEVRTTVEKMMHEQRLRQVLSSPMCK